MFTLGQKKSFGIDIGTQTIKIVEISRVNNGFSIDNYSIWDDDINNVIQQKDSDVSLSPQAITNIIKIMTKQSNMSISEAYIALPSYLAFFAVIQVPILEEKEFLTAVPLEAKKHIPVPLANVQLDWINLGKSVSQDQYNVLIIAIPNTVADRYVEVSKSLAIKIKGFELDCFSTLRSITLPKENVCLIDIGARNSTVMIVDSNKKLQTIQSFDFGGNHLTEAISNLKGCSSIEAENLKKHNGVSGDDVQVSELIQSKINSFILTDVIRLLSNADNLMGISINSVVVLGGASKMSGMVDYIDYVFKNKFSDKNISVSLSSPINNLFVKGVKDDNFSLSIWRDLFLSIGVSLKNYIE
jgi:type IV pilus assembly protein PilM